MSITVPPPCPDRKEGPPTAALHLLALIARTPDFPFLEADLREEHAFKSQSRGHRKADVWYWAQVLSSLPRFALSSLRWSLIMLKNSLTVARRHMIRHKGFSALNILGLASGLACCLLIGFWILDELSFDRFHKNAASIYRVESDTNYNGRILHIYWTPHPLGPALASEFPEIAQSARAWSQRKPLIRAGESATDAWTVWAVDPSFLDMFTFPLKAGNPTRALEGTTSVVLTERAAKAIFGNEEPVGRKLEITGGGTFAVTAILADIPRNSSLQFDVLIPYTALESLGRVGNQFNDNQTATFVRLADRTAADATRAKIRDFIRTKIPESGMKLDLLGLTRLRLQTWSGYEKRTAVESLRLFSLIAALVLLIGCINFMNLSTARSARRAKEIGLRRTVGARRGHIVRQFYGEAAVYALFAMVLALATVTLAFPAFNALTGKSMSWSTLGAGRMALGAIAVALVTALISGSYPAFVLSSFRPVQALRGTLSRGSGGILFRRILVVVQFALSAGLLVGTGVASRQMAFIQNTPLGWSREQVLAVKIPAEARPTIESLKAEMKAVPGVLAAGLSDQSPENSTWSSSGFDWEGRDPQTKIDITYMTVDEGYVEALGIKVVEGRNFSAGLPTDKTEAVLVNETFARMMGTGSAVGKRFDFWSRKGTIVGVLGDFHFQPLRNKIEPLAVKWRESDWTRFMLLRLGPSGVSSVIASLERIWKSRFPGIPFHYSFLDDDFAALYQTELQTASLFKVFSGLAVLVACLGLLGLAAHAAERRTREFAIRKVLGAPARTLIGLICREFVVLIVLANVLSWPAAYLLMRGWLNRFAYRADFSVLLFAGALGISLMIGLLTVAQQALRAARTNPVGALKQE